MKRRPTDSNTEGKKDTGMLKYIRNQVQYPFRFHHSEEVMTIMVTNEVHVTKPLLVRLPFVWWLVFLSGDEPVAGAAFAADQGGSHLDRRHVRRHPASGLGAPAQCG